MIEIKNKKFVAGIFLYVGIAVVIIGLLFDAAIIKSVSEINGDNKSEVELDYDVDENVVINKPDVNGRVILKDISYFSYAYSIEVYDNKYLFSSYDKKLYDLDGNLLLDVSNKKDVSYKNGYIVADNMVYSLDGRLSLDLSNFSDIDYEEEYIKADKKIYSYDGKLLFDGSSYDYYNYVGNYAVVEKNQKKGLVDKDGNIIIGLENDQVSFESETCVWFSKDNKNGKAIYYVYNLKTGKQYGPYVDISYLMDKVIVVDKYLTDDLESIEMWINTNMYETYVVNLENDTETLKNELHDYNFISASFNTVLDGKIVVNKDFEADGVFDSEFNVVVPFEYDDIEILENKYFKLAKGNKRKLVTTNNVVILEYISNEDPFFEDNLEFEDNYIILTTVDGYKEYYDELGNLLYKVSDNVYGYRLEEGKYLFDNTAQNKCTYVDLTENNSIEKNVSSAFCESFDSNDYYLAVKEDKFVQLYDNNLNKVFSSRYDYIYVLDNYCIVKDNDKYSILNYNEERLVEMEIKDFEYLENDGVVLIDNNDNKFYFNYN